VGGVTPYQRSCRSFKRQALTHSRTHMHLFVCRSLTNFFAFFSFTSSSSTLFPSLTRSPHPLLQHLRLVQNLDFSLNLKPAPNEMQV
jgi:hypothetical protein